jgi:hypothetical protein
MVKYEWFVFRSLSEEEFLSKFQSDEALPLRWYEWWTDFYNHRAERFYQEQYNRHELLEFREFSRAYSLRFNYLDELGESEDPEYYFEVWNQ